MKGISVLLFLFIFSSVGFASDNKVSKTPKSFKEMIDYFKLDGVETKSTYSYNKNNMYRIPEQERLALNRKYGNDFYIIEFFLNPISEYQVNELKDAVAYAIKMRNLYKNVILNVHLAAKSTDVALGLMVKMMMEHPEYKIYQEANPVPDLGAAAAYSRGVKFFPTMVVTKGYGKGNNVAMVTKGYLDFLKRIKRMKKLRED